ncbi:MAG: lysylphosphatidylglycerol synthase transmembrane domain-containing protein [Bacteroidota bacterium]
MARIKTLIRTLLFLGIGVGLLWLTFRNQDFSTVWHKMAAADPFWIGICILCSVAALISRSMRWIQLTEPMGYRPRLSSTYHALMFGYLANMALPRRGEVSRGGARIKRDQIPFQNLIGTVIVERALDVLVLAGCILLTAVLEFDRLGHFLIEKLYLPLSEKAGSGTLLFLAAAGIIGAIAVLAAFRMSNPPAFVQKIRTLGAGVLTGLKSVLQVRRKGLFLFHTLFIWLMYYGMSYCCFLALPETRQLGASAALFIMVLGGIGMSAPVQGGIGVYHTLVAQGLLLYGLAETDGIVYATLSHTVSTLLLIVLSIPSMLLLFFSIKSKPSTTA